MAFGEGHALVIGVGSYRATGWDAPITVGDAAGVRAALVDEAVAGYPPSQVELLHDESADLNGVTEALERLAARTGPGDVVLIFFAGHGVPGDDGQYTLTTHDTQFSPGGLALQGTGLDESALLALLRRVRADKLLFIVNACLSGNIHATLGPAAFGAPPTAVLDVRVLASGEGRAVITAARATQSSYFDPSASSTIFGQALIDGLRGAGLTAPGYVSLSHLYDHLYATVTREAAAIGKTQEPVLNLAAGVGPFPVTLFAAAGVDRASLGAPAAGEAFATGVVNSFSADVLAAFRGNATVTVQGDKLVDFSGARIGNLTMGDVAGRDIVKINTTPAVAASVIGRAGLLARIAEARSEVDDLDATAALAGKKEDASDDLRKAVTAGRGGDDARMLEKLESAQATLLELAPSLPNAVALSDTVGVLLQRARTHG